MTSTHLGMGLMFYPRGGSAQVARYLSRALMRHGWDVTLVTGSLGEPGEQSHAATFYEGIDVVPVDYSAAMGAFTSGDDPMLVDPPFHPSYEPRPDVPDRIFTGVAPELANLQDAAWTRAFAAARMEETDVAHLHHLTPMHEAMKLIAPDVPLVTHLHGTDLKMIERIEALAPDSDDANYAHASFWHDRMQREAAQSQRIVTISDQDTELAHELLGIDAAIVRQTPNGVDTRVFAPASPTEDERMAFWTRCLVDEPMGWDANGEPGSVAYEPSDLDAFRRSDGDAPGPVLLFIGRFLDFKRVPLLVRAYARAQAHLNVRAPLVIWGGSPGEWEGEHPVDVARELQVRDVFFSGWRPHDDTAMALACSDVMAAPSVNEPFGQVYLEAMACGLPVIGTATGGPLTFINLDEGSPDGWLVEPDSEQALADAIIEAVNDHGERTARGERSLQTVRGTYSWDAIAERFITTYNEAMQV